MRSWWSMRTRGPLFVLHTIIQRQVVLTRTKLLEIFELSYWFFLLGVSIFRVLDCNSHQKICTVRWKAGLFSDACLHQSSLTAHVFNMKGHFAVSTHYESALLQCCTTVRALPRVWVLSERLEDQSVSPHLKWLVLWVSASNRSSPNWVNWGVNIFAPKSRVRNIGLQSTVLLRKLPCGFWSFLKHFGLSVLDTISSKNTIFKWIGKISSLKECRY